MLTISALQLTPEPLTVAQFAPFGVVIDHPTEGTRIGPSPVIADARPGARVAVTLIHLRSTPLPWRLDVFERHARSGQLFLHLSGGEVLIVVAPAAADGSPDCAAARAFIGARTQAFAYRASIWHAGLAAIGAPAIVASVLSRDGSAGDVDLAAPSLPIDVTSP